MIRRIIEIIQEALDKLAVKLIVSILFAIIVAVFAFLSAKVPCDLKTIPSLVAIGFFVLFGSVGFTYIVFNKSVIRKVYGVVLIVISIITSIFFYENYLLKGLSGLSAQSILIIYPYSFENGQIEEEWNETLDAIEQTISFGGLDANLVAIPVNFKCDIQESILGFHISRNLKVLGYLNVKEIGNDLQILWGIPALDNYSNVAPYLLDVKNVKKRDEVLNNVIQTVSIEYGLDRVKYDVITELEDAPLHYGQSLLAVNFGLDIFDKIKIDEMGYRSIVPIPNQLLVSSGDYINSTYFATHMLMFSYLKLSGYETIAYDAFRNYLKNIGETSDLKVFSNLKATVVAGFLYESGPHVLRRVLENYDKEGDKEIILKHINLLTLQNDTFSHKYLPSFLFDNEDIELINEMKQDIVGLASGGSLAQLNLLHEKYSFMEADHKFHDAFYSILLKRVSALYVSNIKNVDYRRANALFIEKNKVEIRLGIRNRIEVQPFDLFALAPLLLNLQYQDPNFEVKKYVNNRLIHLISSCPNDEIYLFSNQKFDSAFVGIFATAVSDFFQFDDSTTFKSHLINIFSVIHTISPQSSSGLSYDAYRILLKSDGGLKKSANEFLKTLGVNRLLFFLETPEFDEFINYSLSNFRESFHEDRIVNLFNQITEELDFKSEITDPLTLELFYRLFPSFISDNINIEDVQKPVSVANQIHRFILIESMFDRINDHMILESLLSSYEEYYYRYRSDPRYLHFKMLSLYERGDGESAAQIANEIKSKEDCTNKGTYEVLARLLENNDVASVSGISTTSEQNDNSPSHAKVVDLINNNKECIVKHILYKIEMALWTDCAKKNINQYEIESKMLFYEVLDSYADRYYRNLDRLNIVDGAFADLSKGYQD